MNVFSLISMTSLSALATLFVFTLGLIALAAIVLFVLDVSQTHDAVRRIAGKPIGSKTVIGSHGWLQELCAQISRRSIEHTPGCITIDGGDGGTAAASMPLMDKVGITTHDIRLQRGLDPADKAVRVKNFVGKIRYGVGLIAHSCGVAHPRALERHHVRIVQHNGRSLPLAELYPPVDPAR